MMIIRTLKLKVEGRRECSKLIVERKNALSNDNKYALKIKHMVVKLGVFKRR